MRFHVDYENSSHVKTPSHFHMTLIENGQEQEFLGIIDPLFQNDKFIGRCVYLSKSNKQALRKIEEGFFGEFVRRPIFSETVQRNCLCKIW